MRTRLLFAGLIFALPGLAWTADSSPDRGWTVKLSKPGDEVRIEEDGNTTVVRVTSRSGIGKLTIAANKNRSLPERLAVRLVYDQPKKFNKLEGLTITTPRWQVRGNSSQSGKLPFFLPDEKGVFERDDTKPTGWLDLKIESVGDALELQFPPRLILTERQVEIEWIDFYRN